MRTNWRTRSATLFHFNKTSTSGLPIFPFASFNPFASWDASEASAPGIPGEEPPVTVLPLQLNQPLETSLQSFQLTANKMRYGIEKQPFPYYDMYLSDQAFSEMEITLSPRISAGSKVIVESIVEKYNPSATINESHLVGLI